MAEVHALLFIEGRPMNSDAIMARLGISRGNASMSLRTLEEWGIVRRSHCKEDRRDYFAAEQDVHTLFATVICARKRREIDPLLEQLVACRQITAEEAPRTDSGISSANGEASPDARAEHNRKLDEMVEFVRMFDALTTRFLGGDGCGLTAAMQALRAAP
jgi:DNA-binding transcriptional regulator GbsR (MarR family)